MFQCAVNYNPYSGKIQPNRKHKSAAVSKKCRLECKRENNAACAAVLPPVRCNCPSGQSCRNMEERFHLCDNLFFGHLITGFNRLDSRMHSLFFFHLFIQLRLRCTGTANIYSVGFAGFRGYLLIILMELMFQPLIRCLFL